MAPYWQDFTKRTALTIPGHVLPFGRTTAPEDIYVRAYACSTAEAHALRAHGEIPPMLEVAHVAISPDGDIGVVFALAETGCLEIGLLSPRER